MPQYQFKVREDSLQEKFLLSRAKIQIYGGGFANGKTSAAVIKGLELARAYPGSNGLIARATYPKLCDTIRKEWVKWCPSKWIKSFPRSQNSSNTCELVNGTQVNFRYIQQQGKNEEQSTSNLLSANYDWVIVDQMEDPEITHKDFLDLLGRLRGMTAYDPPKSDAWDETMPDTGPRWFIITLNPTRNWCYRKVIKPLKDYLERKVISDDLLCRREKETRKPILDENGEPELLVELVEGSTYENAANLEPDYIETLEAAYEGQMRDRFLLGKWAAYEGLVYPSYDATTHSISRHRIDHYLAELRAQGYEISWVEMYDYGLAVPSCYISGFVDPFGNVICVDGFYEAEMAIDDQADAIWEIRRNLRIPGSNKIFADPSIFRRTPGKGKIVGTSIARDFQMDHRILTQRGNANIKSGIKKVSGYVKVMQYHADPFTGLHGAPHFYHSNDLDWISDEFDNYRWRKSPSGEREDEPIDENDHAMDCIKYGLTKRPEVSQIIVKPHRESHWMEYWHEEPDKVA